MTKRKEPKVSRTLSRLARWREAKRLVADLLRSSGCSCCRNTEAWNEAEEALGKLMSVPRYSDGSGRDWTGLRSRR